MVGDCWVSNFFFARFRFARFTCLLCLFVLPAAAVSGCGSSDEGPAFPPTDDPLVAPSSSVVERPITSSAIASDEQPSAGPVEPAEAQAVTVGAARLLADGFAPLAGLRVGLITNAAATVEGRPVLDLLAEAEAVELVAVFAPEHGIDAIDPAGELIADETDSSGRIAVYSLYGADRAPDPAVLADLDVLIFDLQDVGVRAYTYLSSMGLAMEAASEAGVRFMVLDRPNPLGGELVGGFVREPDLDSFISLFPVPAVHGLSAGEMALAVQGERWLDGLAGLDLEIVEMEGWRRADRWAETGLDWTAPSPSLPSVDSVSLYPATVLFEATALSVGRGTPEPFTVLGGPWVDGEHVASVLAERQLPGVRFEATELEPVASPSVPEPPYAGETIPGVRIVVVDPGAIEPAALGVHLLEVFLAHAAEEGVSELVARPETLDLLAGSRDLRIGLDEGRGAESIIEAWSEDLRRFDEVRARYRLYE